MVTVKAVGGFGNGDFSISERDVKDYYVIPKFKNKQIEVVLELLEEGNTVPFIARYRKEATGSLDEVEIREIEERNKKAVNNIKSSKKLEATVTSKTASNI